MAKVCRYCNADVDGAYAKSGRCRPCSARLRRGEVMPILYGVRLVRKVEVKPDYAMGKYLNLKLR